MMKWIILVGLLAAYIDESSADSPVLDTANDQPSKCLYRYANLKIKVYY